MPSEQKTSSYAAAKTAAAVTAGAVAYVTNTAGAIAGILGFSAPGIAAGSTAAGMMSAAATSGIGGGAISALQSAGATFALATGGGFLATTAAIAIPVATGIGIYKYFTKEPTDTTNNFTPSSEQSKEVDCFVCCEIELFPSSLFKISWKLSKLEPESRHMSDFDKQGNRIALTVFIFKIVRNQIRFPHTA